MPQQSLWVSRSFEDFIFKMLLWEKHFSNRDTSETQQTLLHHCAVQRHLSLLDSTGRNPSRRTALITAQIKPCGIPYNPWDTCHHHPSPPPQKKINQKTNSKPQRTKNPKPKLYKTERKSVRINVSHGELLASTRPSKMFWGQRWGRSSLWVRNAMLWKRHTTN